MRISKHDLARIIREEVNKLSLEENWANDQTRLSVGHPPQEKDPGLFPFGYEDPNGPISAGDPEVLFKNVTMASRILESLPLEDLPEEINSAAQMLRTALEKMS